MIIYIDPSLLVIGWLFCGLLAAYVADRRRLGVAFGWFVTGIILGPFALIAALVVPNDPA